MSPKPRRKPAQRPIYLVVQRLVDPRTGEEVGALVPRTPVDRRTMRERNFHVGTELRGDLRQKRNPKFYRLAHVLGGWLADNVEGFEGHTQHGALKKLQELSGIGVETEEFSMDLGAQLGTVKGKRQVAESLNFEDLDEGRFHELWAGWIEWLRREKWGGLDAALLEEIESILEDPNG